MGFVCDMNGTGMVEIWKDTGECGGPSDLTMTIDEDMPNGGSVVCTGTPCGYTVFSGYVKNTVELIAREGSNQSNVWSIWSSEYAFATKDFGFNDMLQPGDYECPDETDDVYYTIALVMRECMDLSNSKKLSAVYECGAYNRAFLTRTFYNTDDCSGTVETTTYTDYECLNCIDGPTISPTVSPISSDMTDNCAAVYNAKGDALYPLDVCMSFGGQMRQFSCDDDGVGMVHIYSAGAVNDCSGTPSLSITVADHMDQTNASAVCTGTPCDYTTFSGYVTLPSISDGEVDLLQPDDYECRDESDGGAYWTIALVTGECMVLSDSLSAVYQCYDGDLVRTFYDNADCFWPIKNSTTIQYGCLQCSSDDVDDGAMGQTVKVVFAVVLAMGMKL